MRDSVKQGAALVQSVQGLCSIVHSVCPFFIFHIYYCILPNYSEGQT